MKRLIILIFIIGCSNDPLGPGLPYVPEHAKSGYKMSYSVNYPGSWEGTIVYGDFIISTNGTGNTSIVYIGASGELTIKKSDVSGYPIDCKIIKWNIYTNGSSNINKSIIRTKTNSDYIRLKL